MAPISNRVMPKIGLNGPMTNRVMSEDFSRVSLWRLTSLLLGSRSN